MTFAIPFFPLVLSALAPLVVGFVWYHDKIFGARWKRLLGDGVEEKNKEGMGSNLVKHFILAFITSYVLAIFVLNMIIIDVAGAIRLAFVIWVGFVFPLFIVGDIYEPKPKSKELVFIGLGYHLVSLVAMSVILALWL